LAVSVADPGDGLSASLNVALTVNVLPPAFAAPATASVAENGTLVFSRTNSNPISITDVNAGTAVEQLTLSSSHGMIKLGTTTGITFISGTNKSSSMTISGTFSSLNNALRNLTFTPEGGYTGSAAITLTYTDVGNGLGASASIAVTVTGGASAAAIPGGGTTAPLKTAPRASSQLSLVSASQSVDTTNTEGSTPSDPPTQWVGFALALEALSR
jgi:hypothetical protein